LIPQGSSYEDVVAKLKTQHAKTAPPEKLLNGQYHLTDLPLARELARIALSEFMESNSAFKLAELGVVEMERDLISWIGSLLGSQAAAGFVTSGGTESNLTALYAMRNGAGSKNGSVVFPQTAHPTVWKACQVLGLEPLSTQVKDDFTADVEAMRNAIREDTIGIVCTCGTIPWATIDPVQEIGKLADENSLFLHVDAAWAGLICPWLRESGYDIPDFGFMNRGVSFISTDPHKQAFSICPSGLILFRDEELKKNASWTAGTVSGRRYTTFGMLGSRPGSTVAATWALFKLLGRRGYCELSTRCMDLTLKFVKDVTQIPGLEVPAVPKMNMASVSSATVNMSIVKRKLKDQGWHFLDAEGEPFSRTNALGAGIMPYHERVLPNFLGELREISLEASQNQSNR
jgi:tyrosine decarboxylase/aspartate 1-decarboxylase